jgi:hypothetical protein
MKIILKWIVGIFFLLAGVSGAIQKEYEALFLIPLALFIIPLSYKTLIEEKANLKLTSKTKWIVVVIGFLFFGFANAKKEFSKNKDENLTENESTNNDDGRNAKIELTKYYLENDYKKVTDANGIAYELRVKKKEVSRTKMYESKKINWKNEIFPDSNDRGFVIVSSFKVTYDFKLLSNGGVIDVIRYEGYLLDSKRNDRNDYGTICSDTDTYFPELDSENKNQKITDFTGANCGMGEETNNLVKRERIAAVKACGILDAN